MKKRGLKDQKAQRANVRAADHKVQLIRSLQTLQRKKICQLDEEMSEIRRNLISLNSNQLDYFLEPSRPSSARSRTSSRQTQDTKSNKQWKTSRHRLTVTIPHARPTTAPELSREPSKEGIIKKNSNNSLRSHNAQNGTDKKTVSTAQTQNTGTGGTSGMECSEGAANVSSRWKAGNTRVKLGAVHHLAHCNEKRKTETTDLSTNAELDKIKSINKWLSIKNMAQQPKGIPPVAMRYIRSRHQGWKFDLNTFMEKQFPAPAKPKAKPEVSEEVMEEQKKCFNNMTAARALLKFKKRLNDFRAKSEEERRAEKMWEDLKKVRYLRIPGLPTEPRFYSFAPELISRPNSVYDDYLR